MINLVIIVFQGLIEDVKVFKSERDAISFWEQETGQNWPGFAAWTPSERHTIMGDYDGSTIWELEAN